MPTGERPTSESRKKVGEKPLLRLGSRMGEDEEDAEALSLHNRKYKGGREEENDVISGDDDKKKEDSSFTECPRQKKRCTYYYSPTFPTNNALLINFLLSSDAEILLIGID